MPTVVLSETRLTFADAARGLPARDGRHPHPSTLLRWASRGARRADGTRVRLEAARVGVTWFTSLEAVGRFIEELSAPADPAAVPRSPAQREKAAAAAAELERIGV